MPENFKRKLTAILSADAVGYSRLMAEDETATVKTLSSYREIMASLIKQHRGRVVDSPGDNLLAEFSSVVDAVQCAVAVQSEFQTCNAELAENRRMEFRIGINLGDVIDEEDRIYGDGVNVAARLEALADPGGVCVSKTAFDQIESKLPLGYEYLGQKSVKNIPKPVGAYRVLMKPEAVGKVIGEKRFLGRIPRRTAMAAIIILVLIAGGLISWNIYLQQSKRIEPASLGKMAFPLPDRQSIAVLPFVNLSGDPEQEYFVDGITSNIISSLFEFKNLFVIASSSTFSYKGKPVKVQQVSEELGVRYILEGSVQMTSNRMRINAQLIDATTGKHLWAERYDRDAQRLFDIQDEIVETIVATLAFKVDATERKHVMRKAPGNLDAYDYWLRGRNIWFRFTKEANAQARLLFEKAIELDPNWGRPYGYMAWVHVNDVRSGWSEDPEKAMELALKTALKAYELNPDDYETHWTLGHVYLYLRDFDLAIAGYERALELNSNDADFLAQMADALTYMGRPEQAIAQLKKAMRMNPRHPSWYWHVLGFAYYEVGRYKEALATLKQDNKPWFLTHRTLAAVYVRLGRLDGARAEVSKMFEKNPDYTLESEKHKPYDDDARRERLVNDLRMAGVSE